MRHLMPLAGALIVALLLVACGGDDEQDGVPTAPPAAAPTVTPADEGPPPVSGEPVVTESGLQIIDIEVGDGEEARPGQTIAVHYTGWVSGGAKFDSSLDRNQPIVFPLGTGRVIPGWEEGVAGMKVGGKRRLIIPPDLAYGAQGRPPVIPPNAELIFDVELVEIQ